MDQNSPGLGLIKILEGTCEQTHLNERLNGVKGQTAKHLTVNRQKGEILPSTVIKAVVISRQIYGFKVFQISAFQLLISVCVLSKNFLTGTASFHVPKLTSSSLLSGSTSGFKILMINCIDKNKKS